MPLQVARSARANYPLATYVGDRGQLFWDEIQGEIRLSDGTTPGGLPILGSSSSLSPLFISNLPAINPVVQDDDLFLLYDSSSGNLKKVSFQQLGISGQPGFAGSQGSVGFTGSQGNAGLVGFTGSSGSEGYTGSQGLQGLRGYSGSQGDAGYTGSRGQGFVDAQLSQQGELILTYDDSSSLKVGSVIGYTGSQGDIGFTGSQGIGFVDANINQSGELILTREDSSSLNSGKVLGYTGSSGDTGFTGSRGIGFIDAQVSQQGDLILTYEDSSSLNVGQVVGYTGSAGAAGSPGESGIAAVEENSGLSLTDDILSTTYNTLISDAVESVSVGGATSAPASTWKNKNIVQVLDTILFPDLYSTYTVPTISISGNQSGTKEIGQTINQSLTLTATENDAGVFTQLLIKRGATTLSTDVSPTGVAVANIADQYGYTNPNNPNLRYAASYTDTFVVTSGTTSWSGTGSYDAGLAKKNNKGVDDDRPFVVRSTSAPQAASTFNSNAVSVNGIYPYFWGVSSTQPTTSTIASEIVAGISNKVLSSSTGTVAITFNAVAEYVWFAHFASYTTKTRWYNTELNQGAIGAGNFILSPISQGVDSPDGYWNNVLFSIYISDASTLTEGSIQFRNS